MRPDSVPLGKISAHLLVGEISTDRIHRFSFILLMLWCLMQASQLMQLFLKPNAGLLHGHASASASHADEQSGMAGGDWGDAGDGFGGNDDYDDDGMGGHDSSCEPLPGLQHILSDYIIIYIISCISESVSSGTRQVLVLSICLLRSSDDKKGKRAALLGLQGMVALAGAMSQPALSQRMASWQRPGRWSASPSAMPRPASR